MILPDDHGLYRHIEEYLSVARPAIIGSGDAGGAFFVKRSRFGDARFTNRALYRTWRAIIAQHGIYNP